MTSADPGYYDQSYPMATLAPPTPPGPSKGAAKTGDVFPAEATVTAEDATNAAKLAGLGYVATPLTAWTSGQKITVGAYRFSWNGTAWAAGPVPAAPVKGAVKPGDTFPTEATITASDASNAAKLAGLGYVAATPAAWTTGQKFTVGTFDFNWSGTAWAAGSHA